MSPVKGFSGSSGGFSAGLAESSTGLPRFHPQAARAGLRCRRAATRPESLRAGRRTECRIGASGVHVR